MKPRFAFVLLAAFVLPMLLAGRGSSSPRPSRGTAASEVRYRRGKDLVESNCAECEGATREGLLRGIDDLQGALRLHYRDSLAVHRLLLYAYANFSVAYTELRTKEAQQYEKLRVGEIQTIIAADPGDFQTRLLYVGALPDDQALPELRKITIDFPSFASAHYQLALRLLRQGDLEAGSRSARNWLEVAPASDIKNLGPQLFLDLDAKKLDAILRNDPTLYPAHFALTDLLLESGQTADALEHARRLLTLAPPEVARGFAHLLEESLRNHGQEAEGRALHRQFRDKLESPEQR